MAQLPLKQQVVIDTNVWISGLIFGGNPERIIRLFVDGIIVVVISEETLSELRQKVTQRFPLYVPSLALLEASIREKAIKVQLGTRPVTASRDKDDNKFIETALLGECDYIISGDKDLLVLMRYERIHIVNPADFLRLTNLNT